MCNITNRMAYWKQLLVVVALVMQTVIALEYQSYGQFTRAQLSQTIEVVQGVLGGEEGNKARAISDELNAMMDASWYVIYMDKSNNIQNIMVLYGYAFKNHWMWLTNFVESHSVVLWKDYNCHTWVEARRPSFPAAALPLPSALPLDPSALEIDGLNSLRLFDEVSPEYLGEPWKLVFDITSAINNNQNAYAYTGFAVQIPTDDYFAIPDFSYRVCKKAEPYETLLLFQVRIRDFREELAAPAGKGMVMLIRTR